MVPGPNRLVEVPARTFRSLATRFHRKGSTGRRAIIIAQGALKVKWKPSAHVENLVKTGDVQLGKSEYKADAKAAKDRHAAYVGRSIRRLRQKAQKSL